MHNLKMKQSWLAVVSASLLLSACGGSDDSPASEAGLSLDPLTYNGLESEADVNEANYAAIAQQASSVAFAMIVGDELDGLTSDGPMFMPLLASNNMPISGKQIAKAVQGIQKSVIATAEDQLVMPTVGMPVSPGLTVENRTDSESNSITIEGVCGGTVTTAFSYSSSRKSSTDMGEDSPVDNSKNEMGEDMSITFDDYCNYLEDEVTQIILNGETTRASSISVEEDDINDTSVFDYNADMSSRLNIALNSDSFTFEAAGRERRHVDVSYDENLGEDVPNPDTFVQDFIEVVQVSGPGLSSKFTSQVTCDLDPEDLNGSPDCSESEVIRVAGKNYKVEGSAEEDDIDLTIYISEFGSVSVSDESLLTLCEDYTGFESGQLSINSGAVLVTFNGCGLDPEISLAAPIVEAVPE